jgi:phosphocarrier protein
MGAVRSWSRVAAVRVRVASPVGLHARPAGVFVQAVVASGLPVVISKPDDAASAPADARSILAVLALDVACGDDVELTADGERADDVLAALAALLASG